MDAKQDNNFKSGNKITLKDIFLIVWKRKLLLIACTFLGLILAIVGGIVFNARSSTVQTILNLQWEGVFSGEYPDGQRFDYTKMFESHVFAQTIEDSQLDGVLTNELRDAVTIEPIVPSNVYELIEQELLKGNQITYFPNVFKLAIKYADINISKEKGQDVLMVLIDTFRADFERRYIQKSIIIDYTVVDLTTLDYDEAHDILRSQIQLIESVITQTKPQSNTFVSTQLGIGFDDILIQTDLIKSIDLLSVSARINNYLLTKDPSLQITKLRYNIELLELDLESFQKIETGLELMIDAYKGSTTVILIPGLDQSEFEITPHLNTLYQSLESIKVDIANTEKDITYNNLRLERLLGNDPAFIVTPEDKAEQSAIVETYLENTQDQLSDVVDNMKVLLTEYNQYVTRSLINPIMVPQYVPKVNIIIFGLVGIVFGLSIGLGIIFVTYDSKKHFQNQ